MSPIVFGAAERHDISTRPLHPEPSFYPQEDKLAHCREPANSEVIALPLSTRPNPFSRFPDLHPPPAAFKGCERVVSLSVIPPRCAGAKEDRPFRRSVIQVDTSGLGWLRAAGRHRLTQCPCLRLVSRTICNYMHIYIYIYIYIYIVFVYIYLFTYNDTYVDM